MNVYDVIIVGAGPVGLSLALGLGRSHLKVLLLDQKSQISEHSKAPVIWPKTMEVFEELGVVDKFVDVGNKRPTLSAWDVDQGQSLLTLNFNELARETFYPYLLILPQEETERILIDELRSYPNVDVLFSANFLTLEQNDQSVTVTYERNGHSEQATASYLVGCDGAHSKVRETLGLELEGETFPMKAALADVVLPSDTPLNFPRFTTKDGIAVAIQIGKLWRLILPFSMDEKSNLDERIKTSVGDLFNSSEFELVWKSEFSLHNRISSSFVKGRTALAGDAAHLNSPVGGQGMNAGIQDTVSLRRLLLKALEKNDPEFLQEYESERRIKIKVGVNHFTTLLTKLIFWKNARYFKNLIKLSSKVLLQKRLRKTFLRHLMMLNQKL